MSQFGGGQVGMAAFESKRIGPSITIKLNIKLKDKDNNINQ